MLSQGRRDGFDAAVADAAPFLLTCARRLRCPEPDDLAQETACRALERAHHYDPAGGALRGWLATMLRRLELNRRRDAFRRPSPYPLDLADALGVGPRQERAVEARELVRAVAALPQPYRRALRLVCEDGRSYAEAARVLGVPIGTVMSRLSRARARLRSAGW